MLLGLDTPGKHLLFWGYISLFISYYMFAHNAKELSLSVSSASLVLSTAMMKLGIAVYMFLSSDGDWRHLLRSFSLNKRCFLLYLIPAGLYAIYDNFAYWNLRVFDPATYNVLMQTRLVVTGLLFQWMFNKTLSRPQWAALVVIMMGCSLTAYTAANQGKVKEEGSEKEKGGGPSLFHLLLLAIQVLSATFASVYNEALLKKETSCPLNLQNIFMYLHSMAFNLLGLCLKPGSSLSDVFSPSHFLPVLSPYIFPMVLLMASAGIVTSLFLKHLNSVLKSMASAIEVVIIPVVQLFLFGIPVTLSSMVSVVLVGGGIYLYSARPQSLSLPTAPSSTATGTSQKGKYSPGREKRENGSVEDRQSLLERGRPAGALENEE